MSPRLRLRRIEADEFLVFPKEEWIWLSECTEHDSLSIVRSRLHSRAAPRERGLRAVPGRVRRHPHGGQRRQGCVGRRCLPRPVAQRRPAAQPRRRKCHRHRSRELDRCRRLRQHTDEQHGWSARHHAAESAGQRRAPHPGLRQPDLREQPRQLRPGRLRHGHSAGQRHPDRQQRRGRSVRQYASRQQNAAHDRAQLRHRDPPHRRGGDQQRPRVGFALGGDLHPRQHLHRRRGRSRAAGPARDADRLRRRVAVAEHPGRWRHRPGEVRRRGTAGRVADLHPGGRVDDHDQPRTRSRPALRTRIPAYSTAPSRVFRGSCWLAICHAPAKRVCVSSSNRAKARKTRCSRR